MKRRSFLKGAAWAAVGAAVAPELLSCTPNAAGNSRKPDLRAARDFHYGLDGRFKLLQFTDSHYIAGDPRSERALHCIEEMLALEKPDLVISGINLGSNLGSDTLYSGTCGAAQQAAVLGAQAIAVSLDRRDPVHFETAVAVTKHMIGIAKRHPLPFGMFYNVNVPDLPPEDIKGYRVTGLAMVNYNGVYDRREDPLGRPYYWVPRGKLPCDPDEDSDYAWMKKGYVTVTPMGFHNEKLDAVDLSDEFGGEA